MCVSEKNRIVFNHVPINAWATMKKSLLYASLVLTGVLGPLARSEAEVKFRVLSGQETGLGPIIQSWYDESQAQNQGQWWPWGITLLDYDNDGDQDVVASQHHRLGAVLAINQFKETGRIYFVNGNAQIGFPNPVDLAINASNEGPF